MECPICGAWAGDDPETGYMADSPCPNCIANDDLSDWLEAPGDDWLDDDPVYGVGSDPGDEDGA